MGQKCVTELLGRGSAMHEKDRTSTLHACVTCQAGLVLVLPQLAQPALAADVHRHLDVVGILPDWAPLQLLRLCTGSCSHCMGQSSV